MTAKEQREALFWCTVLGPILLEEMDAAEERREVRKLAEKEVVFPSGRKGKPSLSTLKRKLKKYRDGGFNVLARKARSDRGRPRRIPPEILHTAIAAKKEQPRRSHLMLNRILQHQHGKSVARSTLYHHLKQAGATRLKLGISQQKVRKRWSCDHTHEMWVGDFQDGPYVLGAGESIPTFLSAFIDAHSRYIPTGRYYLRENFDILCDTLIRGFELHGIPRAIYVDNAKVYHAEALKAACYRLEIKLLHRPLKDPSPGGVIERFFETAQGQFEAEVRASEMLSLQRINEAFSSWIELVYHQEQHSETHQSPQQRYTEGLLCIRQADMEALAECFLQREERTVNKTFSDIRLHRRFYRVDPKLRGDRLEVRYDPFGPMEEVLLYSLHDVYLGKGILHQRQEGQSLPPPESRPIEFDLLGMLIDEHRKQKAQAPKQIAYPPPPGPAKRPWPFEAFGACFADLLGRRGGLSAFSAEELAALQQVHARNPQLTRTLLKKAFARASRPTVPAVVYELRKLKEQ